MQLTNLVVIVSSVSKVKLVTQVEPGINFSVVLTRQNTILFYKIGNINIIYTYEKYSSSK